MSIYKFVKLLGKEMLSIFLISASWVSKYVLDHQFHSSVNPRLSPLKSNCDQHEKATLKYTSCRLLDDTSLRGVLNIASESSLAVAEETK